MTSESHVTAAPARPRLVGRFVLPQALLVLLAALVSGAAVARLAVWIQNYRAPLIVFPVLVGCGLGLAMVAAMRLAHAGHRATVWSGLVLAVAIAVTGQHFCSFLDWRSARLERRQKEHSLGELLVLDEMKPERATDFWQFMRQQADDGRPLTPTYSLRGAAAWASWIVDGLLTLAAAGTIVFLACRTPYCDKCRSWYHAIRTGSLSAFRARQLAEAASMSVAGPLGGARYRYSQCIGGCSPSRLEMACEGPAGRKALEAWLWGDERQRVLSILESSVEEEA
jgi:hypothetical protein